MELGKKKNPVSGNESNIFVCALIGGGIGFGITLALALILPFAVTGFDDPNSLAMPMACLSAFVGSFAGAFISAKRNGGLSVQTGLLSSAVMLLPMIAVSFIIPGESNMIGALVMVAVIVVAALLGSLAVNKLTGNRKRSMKKVMKRR